MMTTAVEEVHLVAGLPKVVIASDPQTAGGHLRDTTVMTTADEPHHPTDLLDEESTMMNTHEAHLRLDTQSLILERTLMLDLLVHVEVAVMVMAVGMPDTTIVDIEC